MSEDQHTPEDEPRQFPKIEIEEGQISKFVDGWTDIAKGLANFGIEFARAPITIAGRSADGAIQGGKQGSEQGEQLKDKVGKGALGSLGGTIQGTVQGSQVSMKRLGEAFSDIGKGFSKLGASLMGGAEKVGETTGIRPKEE